MWDRQGAPNIWEYFKVGKASGGRITLRSHHGKYVSAQPNGNIEVNRDRALGWEMFKVEDGHNPVTITAVPVTRRTSDTDHAALLASYGRIGLEGAHGFYVSANATCRETTVEDSEIIGVVRVKHNVLALRSRFGKCLSGQ